MILPLSINIEFGNPSFFIYSSLILTLGGYPYYEDYLPYPGYYPISLDVIIIGLAIAVCIPGIYFTHWLGQQPREKAVKKMALGAAVFTSLMTFPLSILMPYTRYMPMLPFYGGSMIDSTVPWVIAVFVILPIMSRQGSFIDFDRKAAYFSDMPEQLIHEQGIRPGRYTYLSYVLGIIALSIPGSAYTYNYYSPGYTSLTLGLITPVWIGTYSSFGSGYAYFYLYMMPSIIAFLYYLLTIFTLIFAYSILQYIQTHIDRMRVISYAALSIIAPYAFFLIASPFMMMIPIPLLLVLGFSIVFLQKQIPPRQTIWEDERVKMWYEKDHGMPIPGHQTSMKQLMRSGPIDTVKVPFSYLIISKMRSFRSQNARSVAETDPTKADWAKTEDPWQSSEEK